ncbi:MAG: glycine--tRNA ligase subunit beta, partial [Gammaproteobacteria bacterium]|nr:glycine--tRNA ligase subunit beta [Gammaproteobacteria bacterium]
GFAFSRPVRWYVALFGKQLVPFVYGGVASGRSSRGTRPLGSPEVEINDPADYFRKMRRRGIIIDR